MSDNQCPECSVSLDGKDPLKHAVSHWGRLTPTSGGVVKTERPINAQAKQRLRQLLATVNLEVA